MSFYKTAHFIKRFFDKKQSQCAFGFFFWEDLNIYCMLYTEGPRKPLFPKNTCI